eukprot:7126016-Alexandrium_andersonii.AAC.1
MGTVSRRVRRRRQLSRTRSQTSTPNRRTWIFGPRRPACCHQRTHAVARCSWCSMSHAAANRPWSWWR